MGYEVACYEGEFKILPDKVPAAFDALLKAMNDPHSNGFFSRPVDGEENTLGGLLEACGFSVELDAFGGIAGLAFGWSKLSNIVDIALVTLAPFVLSGSYLTWKGEEDEHWRKVFWKGKCIEQAGEVTFPLFPWDKEKSCGKCIRLTEDK